ncbi:hypothetical protein B0H17DRAFT_1180504 [Mycena rosella]|uniref:Uncharacterized protein n=1 Tax=Mycena rosella TaxID=1033263 RepID=A0AAD7DD50_MYCRO|nr:hypothetical protein B0H17DRAFT_1180504 [Mycena rosella]
MSSAQVGRKGGKEEEWGGRYIRKAASDGRDDEEINGGEGDVDDEGRDGGKGGGMRRSCSGMQKCRMNAKGWPRAMRSRAATWKHNLNARRVSKRQARGVVSGAEAIGSDRTDSAISEQRCSSSEKVTVLGHWRRRRQADGFATVGTTRGQRKARAKADRMGREGEMGRQFERAASNVGLNERQKLDKLQQNRRDERCIWRYDISLGPHLERRRDISESVNDRGV